MEQEHILNTHIDTLTEWWDEATPGIPKTGDTYIEDERNRGSSFRIVEAATDHKYGFENIRILARAPKPKPAWHEAVAVIAGTRDFGYPRVFVKDDDGIWNDALSGRGHSPDALCNPTPLIEAKVTDEMVDRLRDAVSDHSGKVSRDDIRAWVRAALGLDPA